MRNIGRHDRRSAAIDPVHPAVNPGRDTAPRLVARRRDTRSRGGIVPFGREDTDPWLTPVDVLIIGAGASGAAVAWSLAETKMHILCLEQGDWMKPSEYPSTGRDWEARQLSDFNYNPNRRAPRARTIRSTRTTRRSRSPTSTASAAARCCTPAISRASIRRISACARWTASPTTGRSTTRRWSRSTPRTTA